MSGSGGWKDDQDGGTKNVQILQALEAVYDARSSNKIRQDATRYLDEVKSDEKAPFYGFGLASSREQSAIVRHFGLSLIDHAVRFRWSNYSQEESKALREWVMSLAQHNESTDPPFITNKIAEVWVELAKRSWGLSWMDMDEILFQMWAGTTAQKEMVLSILATLSEEIFSIEDTVVALRDKELNRACIDIFTPTEILSQHFPTREKAINVRYGDEGWLTRMAEALHSSISNDKVVDGLNGLLSKLLSTFKSIVTWIVPNALIATNSLTQVFLCLKVDDTQVQLASMETLYTLYYRTKFSDEDFQSLVGPMFQSSTLDMLRNLYLWLEVDPTEIDDAKYLLLKKFSEMLYNIGRLLAERPSNLPTDADLLGFLNLLLQVVKSPSLQVSIPALHLWAKLLAIDSIAGSSATLTLMGELLETCSQRLVRYEAFPQDSNHPSILFLNEDIETIPEKHAFLGNYSRFCNQIIELVVQQQPIDALYHILGQADGVLEHAYDGETSFHPSTYTKNSVPFLKIDAQFSVIEAALKGCLKWLTSPSNTSVEQKQEVIIRNLEVWCDRLLGLMFEDPLIKERVLQLSVGFSVGPLKRNSQFAVRVFDKILETNCPSHPEFAPYTEAVKDLYAFCAHQMQRLAMKFPDHLVTIYDEIERKVTAVSASVSSDAHSKTRYSSILFIIMHRATNIDPAPREVRMKQMIQPLIDQWQDRVFEDSLLNIQSFSKMLGLDRLQQYLLARNAYSIEEWSAHPLDDEGKALQNRIQAAIDALPLKSTKNFMSVSTEKLGRPSQTFDMACQIWQGYIPLILPNLLRLVSLSQMYQDPANWPNVSPEMKPVVQRIFTDRFWQVGISQGSRDDFYAKIGGTKHTLEGMASSIRATMRTIRECGYKMLYYMSNLGDYLYSFQDLPKPLSDALFTNARVLSPHQMSILVDMVKPIIENCPSGQQAHFLPPMLAALFEQVDQKASSEWERIEERHRTAAREEDLSTEMKDESILRQLTMASVWLVVALLETSRSATSVSYPNDSAPQQASQETRSFILRTPDILKPLILFCTHALRMRDTRACTMIAKVFRGLVLEFAGDSPIETDVREFISAEVLKACIDSLNDPYFVDMQKDFAQLIASIFTTYAARTETPKQVVLLLPGMTEHQVERAIRHLHRAQGNPRQQRATVLDWLQAYRGLAINEQGKLPRPDPKKLKSEMQKKYTTRNMDLRKDREQSPDLVGVSDLLA